MPELLAKMADGQTCVLKVEKGEVTLSYERGLIGKSLLAAGGFKLSQSTGVRAEMGVKPYTSSSKLTIIYLQDGEEMELSVFSREAEKVEELRRVVEDDVKRRREALDRVKREYRETREAELSHLQLDLELAEAIFTLVEELHGKVDWSKLGEAVDQVERIEAERDALADVSTVKLGLGGLRSLVAGRHPKELKTEVSEALETLFQGVFEASKHSHRWFDKRVTYLLLSALYRAWDLRLGSLLVEGPWEMDGGLLQVVDEVIGVLGDEIGVGYTSPSGFEAVRQLVYESVNQLLGVELKADITTVDNLLIF